MPNRRCDTNGAPQRLIGPWLLTSLR